MGRYDYNFRTGSKEKHELLKEKLDLLRRVTGKDTYSVIMAGLGYIEKINQVIADKLKEIDNP
jgi:hypothetical protein